ncbi:AAA family ATPase [Streptomyces sp. NPDC058583]|uniref:helix-turn-helix transcriptional regulator n=1 Tax=unclassified Streptomyces TaxID=2593676 RepID=UPI00365C2831
MPASASARPQPTEEPHHPPAGPIPHHLRPEHDLLTSLLAGLRAGRSAVATVTGGSGHGQGDLVRETSRDAESQGIRVLYARATPAESGLPHGVVGRLLAPLPVPEAGLAVDGAPVDSGTVAPGIDEVLETARPRPTLVAVEQAQWLDHASADWLGTLARRSATAPVFLLVGGTAAATTGPDWRDLAADVPGAVRTHELVLGPMTPEAVAEAVTAACGVPCAEAFAAAAGQGSAANPAVLYEALRRFSRQGCLPEASRAPEILAICTTVLGESAERWMRGLSAETAALVRVLAVCGDLVPFPRVCELAGLRHRGPARLRAAAEATGFVHAGTTGPRIASGIRDRILEGMTRRERAELYARAALSAHRAAAADRVVADLLLESGPIGADWPVQDLRRASRAAGQEGDHARAAACLTRALAEAHDPADRTELTFELAAAELAGVPEAGRRRLEELVRSADGATALRVGALDLALLEGDPGGLHRAAATALPAATGDERDDLIALLWAADEAGDMYRHPTPADPPGLPDPADLPGLPELPVPAAQAGQRAWQLAVRGEGLTEARRLARAALAAPATGAPLLPRLAACTALCLTEDHEEADAGLGTVLAELRGRGLHVGVPRVLAARAELNLRRGRAAAAESDIHEAEHLVPEPERHPVTEPYLRAVRILVDLECGRSGTGTPHTPVRADRTGPYGPHLLFALALARDAEDDPRAAAALLKECGRRLLHRHQVNPALLPWRSTAARLLRRTGDPAEAERLSGDELRLARVWGAPGALGWAELATASDDGPGRLTGARHAVRLLRNGPPGPIYQRALAELAAAETNEGGDRRAAAAAVDELTVLTATQPRGPMAARTRALARRLEPQPPAHSAPASGWATLSPAEARTAVLAAHGHSNSGIAELLSVSRRTVELRLSRVYTKLRIHGRRELPDRVGAPEGTANAC